MDTPSYLPPQPQPQPAKTDPFYGYEYLAQLSARFITHLFACPPFPTQSTHSQAKLPYFIAYALHRTKLHQAVTYVVLILLQRLKTRFPRKLVVLKTPNLILDTADVPNRSYIGRDLKYGVKYSEKDRYTLQSLTSTETIRDDIANNLDAAFKLHSKKPKPSPLLLRYNYGVAAVLWWGKGQSRLHASNRPNVPRPKVPVPDPMGPPRVTHDRQVTRDKLENARAEGALQGAGSAIGRSEQDADLTYAEELVLSLWASTGVAHERRENEAEEYAYRMERWQAGGLFV
ncbi:hypothetical protein B0H14DRAFT_2700246 [Mycena olivaceomarginata]|nr:hypothetical protein B0H14DRAFT_2700246 [Mycena olivaceomarginata]